MAYIYKTILRYCLRNMLFDQWNTPAKAPKICGDTGNVG